ncbi:MAG: hypothetical protein JEZ06_11010 [Anaerolineaceae bacterium]|nr:hypothetical protein [Anaerolineaceae bacterium]
MKKKWMALIVIFLLITVLISSCIQSGRRITDEEMMALARLTVEAGMTETAAAKPPEEAAAPTKQAQMLETKKNQEDTKAPIATATITFTPTERLTPTLSKVMVSVSVDTNCRFGPGESYPYLGALLVGEEAEVIGKGKHGQYWVIKNPDAPGECWIWGQFATLTGPAEKVPVRTPPPTPTPSKTATATPQALMRAFYQTINTCGGRQYVVFNVWNDGNIAFESVRINLHNATQMYREDQDSNNPFLESDIDCPPGEDVLNAGDVLFIAIPDDAFLEASNVLEVDIRMCSGENLSGYCADSFVLKTP